MRHVGQREFPFQDLALHRALEDFRQALHLRLGQRVAGAHAVAEEQVLDQVGREIHHLTVRLAHKRQRADAALHIAGVGVVQMRAQQLAIGVVNLQAVVIENLGRQRIVATGLEPALVRVMHERRVGELLTPVLVVVEEVEIQALDELAQRRRQGTFLGGALAVGEAHRRVRIAQVQRPDIGHDIAPRGDFDLHAQVGQHARQVGDGLLQRQVLAGNVGTRFGVRAGQQQRLGIGVQVLHLLDHELRPGLHHLLHRAPLDGTQNALAVLFGDIRG